ncbi:MAG: hypothetical protein RR942_17160, partial [Romboutsia sp.]
YLIAISITIFIILKNKSIIGNYKILIINIIVLLLTKESTILIYFLLAIAAKNVEDEKIVKYYLWINFILFVSLVAINFIGIIPATEYVHYRIIRGIQVPRADFGFGNPNAVFFNLIPVIAGYIYIRFENYNNKDRILLFSVATLIYFTTYSRNGYLTIIIIMLIIEFIKRYYFVIPKILVKLIPLIPGFFFLVSILIGVFMNNNTLMNKVMSERPRIWWFYINKSSLFGYSHLDKNFPLDNSYIYILVFGGIVLVTFISIILYIGIKKIIEKKDEKLIVIIILFLIYGFNETILFDRAINFSFILIFKNLINYNDIKEG